MSSSTSIFLTNRSDYNSLVLFRHVRQSLTAAQTRTVKAFCTVAASKPGTEFHYLGLLWECAFKAGIASMGTHSEPIACPPTPVATSSSPKFSVPPQSFTRDFSVLRSSSAKPFGTLRQRFRRSSRMRRQLVPVLTAPLQTENSCPRSDPFPPHPIPVPPPPPPQSLLESPESYPPRITPPQTLKDLHYQTPPTTIIPVLHVLPDPRSKIHPSSASTSKSFIWSPSWFGLKPNMSRWIRLPSSKQPNDNFRATFSRR